MRLNTGLIKETIYYAKLNLIKGGFRIGGKPAMIWFLVWDLIRKSKISGKTGLVVLTCDKTHFIKDIEQLELRTDLNLLRLNGGYLEFFLRSFLPKELQRQTHFQKTLDDNSYKKYWAEVDLFCDTLMNQIESRVGLKIQRILVSNIDYWQPEGLRLVAKRRGIPFCALVRENFLLPEQQVSIKRYYLHAGFRFMGERIAVFSDLTKTLYTNSKVFDPGKMVITGAPRFDYWRDIKLPHFADQKTVTLFTFAHPEYLAPNTFKIIMRQFIEQAKKHPNYRFIIKAKDRLDFFLVSKMVDSKPRNLILDYTIPTPEAIRNSRLVIGFNSLTLLESIIARSVVGIPYFNDAKLSDDFLIYTPNNAKHKEVIRFYQIENDVGAHINEVLTTQAQKHYFSEDARLACINSMVYFPTTQTNSQLVADFLETENQQ